MRTLYLLLALFLLTQGVMGQTTRTAIATGDWADDATWSPVGAPGALDDVIIPVGVTVTLSTNWVFFLNFPAELNTIIVNGTLVLNTAAISLNSIDVVRINTGGQILDDGFGGLITSGFTPITSFPIIGPSTITGGALPVTLLFFEGYPVENGVILSWASATELNFDYYRIEHSSDGQKFEMLDTVKGSVNSDQRKDYEYADNAPIVGKNYYRLVSVDLDGYTEYFDVISIDYQPEKIGIAIYPNPVISGDNLSIQPNFKLLPGSKVEVTDLQGKEIVNSFIDGSTLELSTSGLSAGLYIVRLTTNQGYLTEKLIVR